MGAPSSPRVLVVGVGNAYRSDDAVGLIAARQIAARQLPNVQAVEARGEGAALIEAWRDAEVVIEIDAVRSGVKPGTIFRFDARAESLPAHFFHYSTHAFSVAEAVELARVLNQLPPRVVVYGIEGKLFDAGVGLSMEVERAAQSVVSRVMRHIRFASGVHRDRTKHHKTCD